MTPATTKVALSGSPANVPTIASAPSLSTIVNESPVEGVKPAVTVSVALESATDPVTAIWS